MSASNDLTSWDPRHVDFSSQSLIDPITGLLTVNFNFSYEYDPLVEEGINERIIFAELVDGQPFDQGKVILNPEVCTYVYYKKLKTSDKWTIL